MRAYALMQTPDSLEAAYTSSPLYQRAPTQLETIRAVLSGVAPASYRGIGRHPFTEYPEKGPGWQGQGLVAPDPEPHARTLMLESLGPNDFETPYPRAFLQQAEQVWAVYAALTAKSNFEVVELCSSPDLPRNLLGFDIGYWGGGNFSVLCDAAIWPLWHAPDLAALPELAVALQDLNEHALFPTESSAKSYREWYIAQPWAEEEPSRFTVIAVGSLQPTLS